MAYRRLGELLIDAGLITDEELKRGLELQKGGKDRLGTVLIKNNIITEDELIDALQMQLGIEFVDLTKVNIPTELARVLPKNIAKKNQIVPVKTVRDELYVAMSDPLNFYAIEEVKTASKRKVVPMIATSEAIERSIQVLYGNEGAALAIEEMKREAAGNETAVDTSFAANQLGQEDINSAPTVRLVNSILERAIMERASDVHLEPRESGYYVRMRIDGVLRDILTVPANLQGTVISRLKIMSGLDIAERRVPQDGRFNVRIKDKNIDLRVSTLPTIYGEKIVARLLDKSGNRLSREAIGLVGADLEKYEKMIHCHSGVILIVGPTGSGKSTTMYTMIGDLNKPELNLVTLEDPVEYNVDGANQVQINEKLGLTFAGGLRSILRQDPDVIAVGEIRDHETADIAMRAAITGHVVLSTIHTNDAVGTIERLRDIGVEPYLIASALKGVVSQRLVRRICPDCKEEYDASEDEKSLLGVEAGAPLKLYRGKGCPHCFNSGYKGRIAVFEMLPMNAALRRMIADGCGRNEIQKELSKEESGFVSLKENSKRLMISGTTTVDEYNRVINEED